MNTAIITAALIERRIDPIELFLEKSNQIVLTIEIKSHTSSVQSSVPPSDHTLSRQSFFVSVRLKSALSFSLY
jgi:hypothetical protein